MEIVIQPVSERSIDSLVALIGELARFEHLDPPDEAAQARLRADALRAAPPFEAYLALADGEPVGCVTLIAAYSTFAARPKLYIEDLFVRDGHRGRGVGERLFDFCVGLARARGCARLEWNALRWNTAAHRFYERRKGRQVDEWVWYELDPSAG